MAFHHSLLLIVVGPHLRGGSLSTCVSASCSLKFTSTHVDFGPLIFYDQTDGTLCRLGTLIDKVLDSSRSTTQRGRSATMGGGGSKSGSTAKPIQVTELGAGDILLLRQAVRVDGDASLNVNVAKTVYSATSGRQVPSNFRKQRYTLHTSSKDGHLKIKLKSTKLQVFLCRTPSHAALQPCCAGFGAPAQTVCRFYVYGWSRVLAG